MSSTWLVLMAVGLSVAGCRTFPTGPAHVSGDRVRSWNVAGQSDQSDYFQYLDESGRITELGFDDNDDGQTDVKVALTTACPSDDCPHYVILLDGIPYDLVQQLYDEGHFRLFFRPSRLISCFPSMTDLAFCQLFGSAVPNGCEALWYDRDRRKLSGGKLDYLTEKNAPWQAWIDYRAPMLLDAVGYVSPGVVFGQELAGLASTFNRKRQGTVVGYSVGTATVGTRKGRDGLIKCLKRVDRLCERLVYERRGRCRITMLADHGHNLAAAKYLPMAKMLKKAGFKPVAKLGNDPRQVVCIEFGLVTYSVMYTHDPQAVAEALLKNDPVRLACYRDPDQPNSGRIIVRDRDGLAVVRKTASGYRYDTDQGDPLKLQTIIEHLAASGKVSTTGDIDDRALLTATADHEFPDPLARIHRAFNGLVHHPPDLIVTVKDGWFCGAADLASSVTVASTHGSLNHANSVTFVMSMLRPLPPTIRIDELQFILPEIMPVKARK